MAPETIKDCSVLTRALLRTALFAAAALALGAIVAVAAHAQVSVADGRHDRAPARGYDLFGAQAAPLPGYAGPAAVPAADRSGEGRDPVSAFLPDPWGADWIDPWEAPRRVKDFEAQRGPASDTPTLGDAGYWPLLRAISMYGNIVSWGGWEPIPEGGKLELGVIDEVRVPLLRNRLIATGDLNASTGNPTVFDEAVMQAVQRYQARNGLLPDGVVGARTLRALNVPASTRLALLKRNLDRINRLSQDLGERYVFVNIAGQKLEAVENGRVVQRHRVVIGKVDRQTPEYTSRITFLAFNPYWHVPRSIAEKDILPQVRRDPSYLKRLRMRVYARGGGREIDPANVDWSRVDGSTFLLRQEPGPRNSLGTVKIHFPNPHAVYLHDTPSKSLFGRTVRANSSGCVRVEKVHDLTTWLLQPQGYDRARIDALVRSGARKDVYLKNPVPIYMLYLTAWVDEHGVVNFRDDIYGRDTRRVAL